MTDNKAVCEPLRVWNLENLPKIETKFFCRPWVARDALTLVAGPGGAGKSWLCLDLAIAIALGQPWMGYPTVQARVAYFDEDGSEARALNRFRALIKGRETYPDTRDLLENFHFVPFQNVKVDEPGRRARLLATLEHCRPEIVFMDALVAFHSQEENSAPHMGLIMRQCLRGMMRETDISLVVIHHHSKDVRIKGIAPKTATEKLRGSVEIVNASDTILEVLDHSLTMVRNQIIDTWPERVLFAREVDQSDPSDPSVKVRKVTLDGLRGEGKSIREIAESTGISKSQVDRLLKAGKSPPSE